MRKYVGTVLVAGLVAAAMILGPSSASAQRRGAGGDRGPGVRGDQAGGERGPGARGDRGGDRPRFDMAQMRERMVERYREPLDCTDAEWDAIKPLVGKVVEKQFSSRASRFMGMMGGRGRGGPGGDRRGGGDQPERELTSPQKELNALRDALEKPETPAKEIAAKLKALRDARKKSEAELKKARENLRQVLTARQEAQMVLRGILD